MTIQEAIKSGKRFRRVGWNIGIWNAPAVQLSQYAAFSVEQILATDWEIEIVKKEFSAEDIRAACNKIQYPIHCVNELIEHLGLE